MPFLDLVFLVLYFNNKQMLVGVLISLGVRRCFSLKFLISWCWEAHHSFSVLNSSGCCNASRNTLLETTKNGCPLLSWVWVPPPAHTYLGACVRKDMNAQAHTLGVFYISFNHIPLAKGDCWVTASEAQCVAIPAFPWLFSPSLRQILILHQTSSHAD